MIRNLTLIGLTAAAAMAQTAAPKPAAAAPHKPAPASGVPGYSDLKFPPLRAIAAPAVETVTLSNGMRVMLLEDHELPLVNGTLIVRTGSLFDPPDKAGLASLTNQVLLEGGPADAPADRLMERFQDLGAELAGTVSENSLAISFSALKDHSNEVLDLLKRGVTSPGFQQDRLDLAKIQMRNAIAHRNDDPMGILRREFRTAIYGRNSPYALQVENPDVDRINRADLVNFYRRYFFPKNVILSLEGDFDPAAMKTRLSALFDDWNADQPPVPAFPKSEATSPGTFLAAVKGDQQSYFAVGQLGGEYNDPDYPALSILCNILGGGPQSRLQKRLIGSVEGLTVTWSPGFGHPGLFQIAGTVVNPFRTTAVVAEAIAQIGAIRTAEVTDEELRVAKSAAVNSLVFTLDNQLSVMPRLTQFAYFGLPADFVQQYQNGLEAVTRADVLRVARERLDPAKLAAVVVGNPTAFEQPLESLGGSPVSLIDLSIPPSKQEAELGDPISQRRGKELLARLQQAMGGADKLGAVTDYTEEVDYQLDASIGGTTANLTERWMTPSYLRQDNQAATGKFSVYCDGKTGWVANTKGSNALAGVPLQQVQSDLFRVPYVLLLSDRVAGRRVNALDENTVEISEGGSIVKIVLDPATGLPQSVIYDAPTTNGPAPVIEKYSDFRDVSGVKIPFKVAVTLSGKKYEDLTVKRAQLNTGLKLADLQKRP